MTSVVYHVTSTLALPWIIESGALLPFPNLLRGIGMCTYLWGTVNRRGDKTSLAAIMAAKQKKAWPPQSDRSRLVRFTLPADAFLTWNEVVRASDWTPEQVAELVEQDRVDYGETGQAQWRCCQDPLRLTDVLKTEVRTPAGRWSRIVLDPARLVRTPHHRCCLGYRIGREVFYGVRTQIGSALGLPFYDFRPLSWMDVLLMQPPRQEEDAAVVISDEDRMADQLLVARWEALEAAENEDWHEDGDGWDER
jgi:hypothetical protein